VGDDAPTTVTLPRTRLLTPAQLGEGGNGWDVWGHYYSVPGTRVKPSAGVWQSAGKAAFKTGQMAGNYLNLYATVSQEVLKALNVRTASSLGVVIRNAKNSYDVPISCPGGVAAGCGSIVFNSKSDAEWSDSLQWEAFDASGKLLASAMVKSAVQQGGTDTGMAVLWAASDMHFSEKKELPLGPVFGFIDDWASLLSLPGDSVTPALAAYYDAHGVPRIFNASIKDVIPNYEEGQIANPGNTANPDPWAQNPPVTNPNPVTDPWKPNPVTALAARLGALSAPSAWKIERSSGGFVVRIQGLAEGLDAVVEMYDLAGKLAGSWAPRSVEGALNLSASAVRPGVYMLKIRIAGKMASKRIAF
jgi:hypothetical protein